MSSDASIVSYIAAHQDFKYIINGYCQGLAGESFVKRGDYKLILADDDSQTINPEDFARTVEPGMVLEMSIILRQRTAYQQICPRCKHTNRSMNKGWIKWQVPANYSICK